MSMGNCCRDYCSSLPQTFCVSTGGTMLPAPGEACCHPLCHEGWEPHSSTEPFVITRCPSPTLWCCWAFRPPKKHWCVFTLPWRMTGAWERRISCGRTRWRCKRISLEPRITYIWLWKVLLRGWLWMLSLLSQTRNSLSLSSLISGLFFLSSSQPGTLE